MGHQLSQGFDTQKRCQQHNKENKNQVPSEKKFRLKMITKYINNTINIVIFACESECCSLNYGQMMEGSFSEIGWKIVMPDVGKDGLLHMRV